VTSDGLTVLGSSVREPIDHVEVFAAPAHVTAVRLITDEVASLCPVTGQPDLYVATIEFWPQALCIESKSLKLYLSGFRNEGHFCEALAVRIRDDVAAAVHVPADRVRVTLVQKARGGITITATA
jgi:7-cyano-7-deazaguanine reductase